MPLPIIVPISRHVRGLETLAHFILGPKSSAAGYVCLHCSKWGDDVIAPVSLLDGGEVDPDGDSGAYLCEPCSLNLPNVRRFIREEWPATLTALEVERIWALIRREQQRESANEAARERSVATCLEDLQGACAALQQTRSHQGVDGVGKVA